MSTVENAVTRGEKLVAAYRKQGMWGNYEEIISDMLADLMHFVDALRVDRELEDEDSGFDTMLDRAEMNYTAEKEEDE